jgi:hypothetical protein
MAKRQSTTAFLGLAPETMIEVIAERQGKYYLSEMSYREWLVLKRKSGFSYRAYQKGFHQFVLENKK